MKRLEPIELPAEEIEHQKSLMREFAALEHRPRTYCVVTYGCQMNAHDSEKLEGMLAEMGMQKAESRETADFGSDVIRLLRRHSPAHVFLSMHRFSCVQPMAVMQKNMKSTRLAQACRFPAMPSRSIKRTEL